MSELLCSREVPASDGNFSMNFSGRKRESDLGFPEYWEPQPSDRLVPDRRSLAFKALEREASMQVTEDSQLLCQADFWINAGCMSPSANMLKPPFLKE